MPLITFVAEPTAENNVYHKKCDPYCITAGCSRSRSFASEIRPRCICFRSETFSVPFAELPSWDFYPMSGLASTAAYEAYGNMVMTMA